MARRPPQDLPLVLLLGRAGRGGPGPPLRDGLQRWGATFVLLAAVAATLPIAGGQGFLDVYATWCGDGVCESGIEEAGWCARDCSCGDGVCDESEAIAASVAGQVTPKAERRQLERAAGHAVV